jgi:hypothetical protein
VRSFARQIGLTATTAALLYRELVMSALSLLDPRRRSAR